MNTLVNHRFDTMLKKANSQKFYAIRIWTRNLHHAPTNEETGAWERK